MTKDQLLSLWNADNWEVMSCGVYFTAHRADADKELHINCNDYNMFCDEHNPAQLAHRPLQRYEIPASKLVLELGYNIDYEDEKESFEVDEADTVELVNGERMPWEQVKRDGIDYIALYYVNDKGKQVQILDAELA